jgi:hypothetical protein
MPTRPVPVNVQPAGALLRALAQFATMIGEALAAHGLGPSLYLPPPQVYDAPTAVHLLGDSDIQILERDACSVTLLCPVLSYYFVGPGADAKADTYAKAVNWLELVVRAHMLNWSLDGLAFEAAPRSARYIGLTDWGGQAWTVLRVRSDLDLELDVTKEW